MKKIEYMGHKNFIHSNLRALRKRRGLTQKQLAAAMQTLGVSIDQESISRIEADARTVMDYELTCFAQVLGVELHELIDTSLIDK